MRVPGVHVHYCPRRQTLNDLYMRTARRVRGNDKAAAATPKPAAAHPGGTGSLLGGLRREIGSLLDFPDFARGWILRAALQARALLRQTRFDAVVTSGPPHAAHIAGVLATWGRSVPLIADFRDPWADQLRHGAVRRVPWLQRAMIPRLERLVLRRAARIISNTQEFAGRLQGLGTGRAVHFVPNGIDRERLPGRPETLYDGFSIAHVGTLYLGRDFSPVFKAIALFSLRHPDARGQFKLRVAGVLDGHHAQLFDEQMKAAGLTDLVELHGLVPNDQALDLLNRSHLALVLAQNQPMQIPAKLYECLGLHVPTLVISESDSAAAREAQRLGAHTRESTDIEGICQVIERVWRAGGARHSPTESIDYQDLALEMDGTSRAHRLAANAIRKSEASLTGLAGERGVG